jgi:hypothetical protein
MAYLEKEIIEKINMTAEAEETLECAFLDDAAFIKNEIQQGVAELFKVGNAFFVTRIERSNKNKELVIIALAGSGLVASSVHIFNAAKLAGCKSIRFHTKRRGLAKLLTHLKPEYVETVYKINV